MLARMRMESKKRKPLADITNAYNLIPTSALDDLVDSSSNVNSSLRPPSSILNAISNSTDQKLCSDRSDTSIGSSNVNSARSSRSVRFRSHPHIFSFTSTQGNRDVAKTKRQTIEKNNKGAGEVVIGYPTLTGKREDKGKTIDVPYSVFPHESDNAEKRKDRGKAIALPICSPPGVSKVDALTCSPIPVGRRKDRDKTIAVPFSSPSHVSEAGTLTFSPTAAGRRNEKGKGIAVTCSLLPYVSEAEILSFSPALDGKGKDKGKGATVPCSSLSRVSEVDVSPDVKRKDKGHAMSVPFTSSMHEGKADVHIVTPAPVEKGKEKGKAIDLPLSSSSCESEGDFLIISSTAAEKAKYKGKVIAELFNSSTPLAIKDNQNAVYSSYTPLERNMQQNERKPFSAGFDEIMDDPSQKVRKPYMRVNEKTDKGKVVSNLFGSSVGKQKQKEKGTASHYTHSSERGSARTKRVAGIFGSPIMKTKESGKEIVFHYIERTRKKGGQQNLSVSLPKKTKDKGKAISQSSCKVEIAAHKVASHTAECQSPQRKSQKGKNDAGVSSCPPLNKAGKLWTNLDDVEDNNSSLLTDPHPKWKKARHTRNEQISELPQDYVEQQKAYFKEVDEFELPEEEASQDEL